MSTLRLVLFSCVLLAGCKKTVTFSSSSSGSDDGHGTSQAAASSAFPDFDLAAAQHKLQGTWVFKGNMGKATAWSIAGNQVTTGSGESGELRVISPCQLQMWVKHPDGSGEGTNYDYAIDGDSVWLGLGNGGAMSAGGAIAACADGNVYLMKDGKCQKGEEDFMNRGKWSWSPADCTLQGTTFKVGTSEFTVKGKALVNQQLDDSKAEKVADLTAAKAKL